MSAAMEIENDDTHDFDRGDINRNAIRQMIEGVYSLLSGQRQNIDIRQTLHALEASTSKRSEALNIIERFGLSDADADIFALIAACDMSSNVRNQIAELHDDLSGGVTPQLIDQYYSESGSRALTPVSTLRRFSLIQPLQARLPFETQTLLLDETVRHALLGNPSPGPALSSVLEPVQADMASPDALVSLYVSAMQLDQRPALHLAMDPHEGVPLAASCLRSVGLHAFMLNVDFVSAKDLDHDNFNRFLERDLTLLGAGLIIPIGQRTSDEQRAAVFRLARRIKSGVFLISVDNPAMGFDRHAISIRATDFRADEASNIPLTPELVDQVRRHFGLRDSLLTPLIEKAALLPNADLWQEAKTVASEPLSKLAEKITPQAEWDDLILPRGQKQLLLQMTSFLPQRDKVFQEWGFAAKSARGLGLVALFTGDSGGGKTMAAEIIAKCMGPDATRGLDLYRIDLSAMISKYIGETEKNLSRVFDAAENSGAVLLFDEGDALFARRGKDVNTSVDRHANQETAYLLQRLESYQGVAILTTNLKDAIDPAFLRRFRFIIDFPFPNAELRRQIWQSVLPDQLPLENVDLDLLAQLDLTGGQIRTMAITAAFIAASEPSEVVTMEHFQQAAYQEFDKQNRSMPDLNWSRSE